MVENEKRSAQQILGMNVWVFLREKGMSQAKLAKLAHIAPATICHLIAGKANPRVTDLEKIAEVLEVDVRSLFN